MGSTVWVFQCKAKLLSCVTPGVAWRCDFALHWTFKELARDRGEGRLLGAGVGRGFLGPWVYSDFFGAGLSHGDFFSGVYWTLECRRLLGCGMDPAVVASGPLGGRERVCRWWWKCGEIFCAGRTLGYSVVVMLSDSWPSVGQEQIGGA